MDASVKERPTSATVLGWLYIASGVLAVLSAALGGLMWSVFLRRFLTRFGELGSAPGAFRILSFYVDHFGVVIGIQAVVAVGATAAGIGLLRLQAWGRALAEVLAWLGLAWVVGFGVFWIRAILDFPVGDQGLPVVFRVFMLAAGLVGMLIQGGLIVLVLCFLRRKTLREAVSRRT